MLKIIGLITLVFGLLLMSTPVMAHTHTHRHIHHQWGKHPNYKIISCFCRVKFRRENLTTHEVLYTGEAVIQAYNINKAEVKNDILRSFKHYEIPGNNLVTFDEKCDEILDLYPICVIP